MSSYPRVDIILLNFKGWRDTIDCLESVLRLDYPAYRVIVCENGSPDDSWDRLHAWARGEQLAGDRIDAPLHELISPAVPKPLPFVDLRESDVSGSPHDLAHRVGDQRLVFIDVGENRGFTGGNNVGLRFALATGADYALLLNNDTLIAPDALSALVGCAEADRTLGVVGGTILDFRETDTVQEAGGGTFAPWHGMVRMSQAGVSRHAVQPGCALDYVSGALYFARADAIRQVGVLDDERFFIYGEDQDYSVRMRRAGWRLAYCPEAIIWHRGGGTFNHRNATFDYHTVRSTLRLVRKHYPYCVPTAALYSIYRCVLPKLVRGQWSRLRAVGSAYRDFILGASTMPSTPVAARARPVGHSTS